VPIIDIGIKKYEYPSKYETFNKAIENDCLIKSNITGEPIVNRVWPGDAVFLDYNHPKSYDVWSESLAKLHKEFPFDGNFFLI
jgi:alpha-glucosidase (family GH31 glycosyl hydrolase)